MPLVKNVGGVVDGNAIRLFLSDSSNIKCNAVSFIVGMLIIHHRAPVVPQYAVFVTDWYHVDHLTIDARHGYALQHPGSGDFVTGYRDREYSVDGVELTSFAYVSALIGGRGRWNPDWRGLPLAKFTLLAPRGSDNRFRLVHAGAEYSYEVIADGHVIRLLAADGYDVAKYDVDSAVIHPGESLDFQVVPDSGAAGGGVPVAGDRFWLRARTLGDAVGPEMIRQRGNVSHEVKAVIVYGKKTNKLTAALFF